MGNHAMHSVTMHIMNECEIFTSWPVNYHGDVALYAGDTSCLLLVMPPGFVFSRVSFASFFFHSYWKRIYIIQDVGGIEHCRPLSLLPWRTQENTS